MSLRRSSAQSCSQSYRGTDGLYPCRYKNGGALLELDFQHHRLLLVRPKQWVSGRDLIEILPCKSWAQFIKDWPRSAGFTKVHIQALVQHNPAAQPEAARHYSTLALAREPLHYPNDHSTTRPQPPPTSTIPTDSTHALSLRHGADNRQSLISCLV